MILMDVKFKFQLNILSLFSIADCEHIKKENAASLERQEQLKIDLEATRITYERLVTKNRREEKKAMEEK